MRTIDFNFILYYRSPSYFCTKMTYKSSLDTFCILKNFVIFFCSFWPLRVIPLLRNSKVLNHIYVYLYNWVLECSFLIETLKLGCIYNLHFLSIDIWLKSMIHIFLILKTLLTLKGPKCAKNSKISKNCLWNTYISYINV